MDFELARLSGATQFLFLCIKGITLFLHKIKLISICGDGTGLLTLCNCLVMEYQISK